MIFWYTVCYLNQILISDGLQIQAFMCRVMWDLCLPNTWPSNHFIKVWHENLVCYITDIGTHNSGQRNSRNIFNQNMYFFYHVRPQFFMYYSYWTKHLTFLHAKIMFWGLCRVKEEANEFMFLVDMVPCTSSEWQLCSIHIHRESYTQPIAKITRSS